MSEQKEAAQVPEESLEEVSGGWRIGTMKYTKRFVCNECGEEKKVLCTVGIERDDQRAAQMFHDQHKGKTGKCTTGKMEYKP